MGEDCGVVEGFGALEAGRVDKSLAFFPSSNPDPNPNPSRAIGLSQVECVHSCASCTFVSPLLRLCLWLWHMDRPQVSGGSDDLGHGLPGVGDELGVGLLVLVLEDGLQPLT